MCNNLQFYEGLGTIMKKFNYLLLVVCTMAQIMTGNLVAMNLSKALLLQEGARVAAAVAPRETGAQCSVRREHVEEIKVIMGDYAGNNTYLALQIDETALKKFRSYADMITFIIENYCDRLEEGGRLINMMSTRKLTFKNIEGIHIKGFLYEFISRIGDQAFSNIETFCLYGCKNVSSVNLLITNQLFPKLSELDFSWSQITEDSLISIFRNFRLLKNLILCNCGKLTGRGLIAIANCCKELELLDLAWCAKITDAGFIDITKWCRKLRTLSLLGCALLTDQSLEALRKCEELEWLNLHNCINITDTGILAILGYQKGADGFYQKVAHRCCKNLKKLHFNNGFKITEPCKSLVDRVVR